MTVTGRLRDITDKMGKAVQCSNDKCTDMEAYLKVRPNLPDVNARIQAWSPKLANTSAGQNYDPRLKDWGSAIQACRSVFKYEKRLANFFIRSAFHDSMAVDVSECPGPLCGGADASLLLTAEELVRAENANDNFAVLTARVAKKIASFYDLSVADTLAVCGAVGTEVLSDGRVKVIGTGSQGLRVGRLDHLTPAPPGQLPPPDIGVDGFVKFWSDRGFTVNEAVALMGAHALIDEQGCFQGPSKKDYCNPEVSTCTDVRMFKWQNHYFHDICSPQLIAKKIPASRIEPIDTPVLGMSHDELNAEIRLATCKFTSKEFRAAAVNQLRLIQQGNVVDPDLAVPPETFDVFWNSRGCRAASAWFVNVTRNCPHSSMWFYTPNDALLGIACQTTATTGVGANTAAIRDAARAYLNQANWDMYYPAAYRKMVERFATYAPLVASTPAYTTGSECPSGTLLEPGCAQASPGPATSDVLTLYNGCPWCRSVCTSCCSCVTRSGLTSTNPLVSCSNCCVCSTAVRDMVYVASTGRVETTKMAMRFTDVQTVATAAAPLPVAAPAPVPFPNNTDIPITDSIAPVITVNGVFSSPPVSPYIDVAATCPAAHGTVVEVRGFPSSPFAWTPFTTPFTKPATLNKTRSYCKPGTKFCVDAYELDVYPQAIDIGCPAGPTRFLTYGGMVPGPTIHVLKGRQTMVRFNNKMTNDNLGGFTTYAPCDTDAGRQGRPIAVHLHGEASLAPYDGWAEDSTCGGETKDYYYPNRRPAFQWYHDHQLEITSENAYFGLAGMYIVHDEVSRGGCGEPWNLDNIPDTEMQFKDAVVDAGCQLLYDRFGAHARNLYGDVNFVNGKPWPVMPITPTWHRFRWLNAAVARPWKLRIVDNTGADVSGTHCQVIAGDGGFRREPTAFPAGGLFMGVAERVEVVCDLSRYGGRTLYMWNAQDEERMKDVPFYCHSHLVMKFQVEGCGGVVPCPIPVGAEFRPPVPPIATPLDAVLTQADIDAALALVAAGTPTRFFKFGRRHGHWVINGETWHTRRVAASDIGQNAWEVWELKTGGGWFHPIHIHLVDFYIIARNGNPALVHDYERWNPKDVVQLDPSGSVSLLVRFGPHKGEYMFHCHNLVHEDTEMMRSYDIINGTLGRTGPNTLLPLERQPSLVASNNILYDLYDDPVLPRWGPKPTASVTPLSDPASTTALSYPIDQGLYRMFYPGQSPLEDPRLADPTLNPWIATICQAQSP